MRVIRTLAISFSALFVLTACGTQDKQHDQATDQAPELSSEEKAELEQEFAKLPPAAIVRVPVDAEGNPTGEPEMRVVQEGAAPSTDAEMDTAWSDAEAPQAMVDGEGELDADSSTQSWSSWGSGYCGSQSRCGGGYGHGNCGSQNRCGGGYGYGNCGSQNRCGGYGNDYFGQIYRPQLYTRGYRWNYNRGYNCRRGNYKYYSYRPNRHW